MSRLKLAGATAVLILAIVPASAQPVISEPGYCAFFYPYANCQNKGPGNPYTDPSYPRGPGQDVWSTRQSTGIGAMKSRTHRARSSTTRIQQ